MGQDFEDLVMTIRHEQWQKGASLLVDLVKELARRLPEDEQNAIARKILGRPDPRPGGEQS